jgi:hypothetical protein
MSPSLFLCASGSKVSELDIAYGWGSVEGARSVLERHWDTWITQSDMEYLAGIGINTVRLPIGYWNLGPEHCKGTNYDQVSSVYQNSWPRVKRAINMAGKSGLGVLVDLHGAVGSQNGQGHSGVSDGVTGLFQSQNNMDSTANVLNFLMKELASVTNVVGIQMLNEPKDVPELIPFCTLVIPLVRLNCSQETRRKSHRGDEASLAVREFLPSIFTRRVQPLEIQRLCSWTGRLRCAGLPFILRIYPLRCLHTCLQAF